MGQRISGIFDDVGLCSHVMHGGGRFDPKPGPEQLESTLGRPQRLVRVPTPTTGLGQFSDRRFQLDDSKRLTAEHLIGYRTFPTVAYGLNGAFSVSLRRLSSGSMDVLLAGCINEGRYGRNAMKKLAAFSFAVLQMTPLGSSPRTGAGTMSGARGPIVDAAAAVRWC